MKLLDIIHDANRNLMRNKGRTILTIIAIFIGALTLTITNGIGAGVSGYIDQQLGNIGADDVIIVQPKVEDFGGGPQKYEPESTTASRSEFTPFLTSLNQSDLAAIKAIPGIVSADPQINVAPDYIEGANEEQYRFIVSPYVDGMNMTLSSGRLPENGSPQNQIVLLPDFPQSLGFDSASGAIGKTVVIGITSMRGEQSEVEALVVGVSEEALTTSFNGATINQALVNSLYDIQSDGQPESTRDSFSAVLARVSKESTETDINNVKSRLDAEGYEATTVKDQIGTFKQVINAIILVLNVFAGIALLAASFGIVNTLLMAVQERTKEIGLMKAMGLSGRKIFLLFSFEAILIGFWGSLLGSLAGIALGTVANQVASNTFLKDLPGFNLTSFSPQSVATIMLIIMTIAFIAGTLPARRASRKDPIDALRYE